jgi:hypothetical protein
MDDIVDEDIENFIFHSFRRYPKLDSRWPNKEWCRLLVYHSEHSFQWSATARRFIKGYYLEGLDRYELLDLLLQPPVSVEATPHSILQQMTSRPDLF